jgi:hypothetical protein
MNLMSLEAGADGAVIAGTGGPAVAPADCAGLTLGVRPEDVTLAFDRGVPATVAAIEYLGADTLVTCRLGATTLAVRVPVASVSRPAIRRGSCGRRALSICSIVTAFAGASSRNHKPPRSSRDFLASLKRPIFLSL